MDKVSEIFANENIVFDRITKSRMIYLDAIKTAEERLENLIYSLFN